jgi:sterol desaturase/sphingolipid hydroxylase (fatty acid hydroxylase superfamily)
MSTIIVSLFLFVILALEVSAEIKSRKNRRARQEAIRQGIPVPDRDMWTRIFSFLTPIIVLAAVYFVWKNKLI